MHGFADPSGRAEISLVGRVARLYFRWSSNVENVARFAARFFPHSVDHVVSNASVLTLVGPLDVFETQATTVVSALRVRYHLGVGPTTEMDPSVISRWIRVEFTTFECVQGRTEQRDYGFFRFWRILVARWRDPGAV